MWKWMETQGWKHVDTMWQISQFSIQQSIGHISQSSNGQSASLMIMCYGCIEPSWMVPFSLLLVYHHSIHFTILTAFCHHYFDYSLLIWVNSLVLFVILAIDSLSLYVIYELSCCCFYNIFLLVFEYFLNHMSIALLPGLKKFVSPHDRSCFEQFFWWYCLLHDKWSVWIW